MTTPFQLRNSITKPNQVYPLDIIRPPVNSQVFGAPLSNGEIHLHDISTLQLLTCLPPPTQDTILTHCMFDTESPHLLWAGNKSGTILLYDSRTNSAVHQLVAEKPVISFDINSSHTLLACGTELTGEDSYINFWDLRNLNTIYKRFEECHSDDVTQIKFHPSEPKAMISGSTDGLFCLYNLETMEEDDALYQVIKADSVSKIGYFGPNYEYLYCLTHMETFSIWTFEEANQICSFGDVRANTPELKLDYCIDCYYEPSHERLYLTAGSQDGAVGILNVSLNGLELTFTLNGGHSDIVRGTYWDLNNSYFISGGEDGRISLWTQ